jgi:hypothetical protein
VDRLAGTAGVLRADVAHDGELGGLDVELFADVFAERPHSPQAQVAGSWRISIRGRCAGRGWRPARARRRGDPFDFGFDGSLVGGQGFLEQVARLRREDFALHAVAQALQVREFEAQGLNLGFGVLETGLTLGQAGLQVGAFGGLVLEVFEESGDGLGGRQLGRRGDAVGEAQGAGFQGRIHASIIPGLPCRKRRRQGLGEVFGGSPAG